MFVFKDIMHEVRKKLGFLLISSIVFWSSNFVAVIIIKKIVMPGERMWA